MQLLEEINQKDPPDKCVIRLTTGYWHDCNGVYVKKSLRFLKRKCVGFNILYEDAYNGGAESVIPNIINLHECKDGIYQIVTINEFSAWETPHILEDYDYKLIPYQLPMTLKE